MTPMKSSPISKQSGVLLLEALIAILIFSLGIMALLGLQASSIANVAQSKYRTDASYLANQIIGKMWVDQNNLSSYQTAGYSGRAGWDNTVAKTLPAGVGRITVTAGTTVTVVVQWKSPNDINAHSYTSIANINPS